MMNKTVKLCLLFTPLPLTITTTTTSSEVSSERYLSQGFLDRALCPNSDSSLLKISGTLDQSHSHCHSVSWPKPILLSPKTALSIAAHPPTAGAQSRCSSYLRVPIEYHPAALSPKYFTPSRSHTHSAQAQPVTTLVSAPGSGHRQKLEWGNLDPTAEARTVWPPGCRIVFARILGRVQARV